MQKCNNINEIINKIREMDYDKETCIAELTSYNPETRTHGSNEIYIHNPSKKIKLS